MKVCCNSKFTWYWHLCNFLLVCYIYHLIPTTQGYQIDLSNPLPDFSDVIYEVEIPMDQPLMSTILTVKARDRDVEPSPYICEEFRSILVNETTEDRCQAMSAKPPPIPTEAILREWVQSHLSDEYSSVREGRLVAIDQESGSVRLNKPLDSSVGRITARVLIVAFPSPFIKEVVTLVIRVKHNSSPFCSSSSVQVCWSWSSLGSGFLGFYLLFLHRHI